MADYIAYSDNHKFNNSLESPPELSSPASSDIDIHVDKCLIASTQILIKSGLTQPLSIKPTELHKNYVLRKGNKIIYTAGRPPWYDFQGSDKNGSLQCKEAFVIGLGGGSASGKTTVANSIIKSLDIPWVVLVTMDSFYREYNDKEKQLIAAGEFDFDNPSAMDFELILQTISKLKSGKSVFIPIYNFTTHKREKHWRKMYGANVIIFEGIHAFYDKRINEMMDLKIFVDSDSDIRLARRLLRDITQRGRDLEGVLKQYEKFVKPSFHHYIAPTMAVADIIIPRGGENYIALNLIADHIKSQLQKRGFKHRSTILLNNIFAQNSLVYPNFCDQSTKIAENGGDLPNRVCCKINDASNTVFSSLILDEKSDNYGFRTKENYGLHLLDLNKSSTNGQSNIQSSKIDNLFLTPNVSQTIGLHTIIRNKDVNRQDFIFFSRRLSRIALEYATSFLPYEEVNVETHQHQNYKGIRLQKNTQICGVSIIRAGETTERSLFEVFQPAEISLGQILIQTNFDTGEPELFYYRLPDTIIKESHVLLMDPTAATGATVIMAIRVLLDHEVPEENIILVTLILSEIAAQTIAYAFPKIKIITTAIDPFVSPDFYILPGIGNFGDRYYGTESKGSLTSPKSPISIIKKTELLL